MSECVVRMDFPKRCCDCDMADGLACMATGGVYGRDVPKMTWIRGKPEWCPIICQLPEGHGRLIDADALKEWFIEQIDYYKRFDGPNCSMMVSAYEAVCQVINDAPTIVPADTAERSET